MPFEKLQLSEAEQIKGIAFAQRERFNSETEPRAQRSVPAMAKLMAKLFIGAGSLVAVGCDKPSNQIPSSPSQGQKQVENHTQKQDDGRDVFGRPRRSQEQTEQKRAQDIAMVKSILQMKGYNVGESFKAGFSKEMGEIVEIEFEGQKISVTDAEREAAKQHHPEPQQSRSSMEDTQPSERSVDAPQPEKKTNPELDDFIQDKKITSDAAKDF
jgi:hypothetical protein